MSKNLIKQISSYSVEVIREIPRHTTTIPGNIKSFFMKPNKGGKWCQKSEVRKLEKNCQEMLEELIDIAGCMECPSSKNIWDIIDVIEKVSGKTYEENKEILYDE